VRIELCVFFFFQAEDGIRDLTVTGVQTCALPILIVGETEGTHGGGGVSTADHRKAVNLGESLGDGLGAELEALDLENAHWSVPRSEERRVGKECRSRWSPYH